MSSCHCPEPVRSDDGVCVLCGDGAKEVRRRGTRGGRRAHVAEPMPPPLPARPALANVELVQLDPADLKYIARVAAARLASKHPGTNKLRSVTGIHSEDKLHRLGVTAKYAFCKAWGLPFDESIRATGDKGFDTVLPDRRTVRIKSRDRIGADLITAKDEIVADLVVLAEIITPDVVKFVGFISRDGFYASCSLHDFGHGMRQIVRARKLHRMIDLLKPASALREPERVAATAKRGTLQGRLM